MRSGWWLVSNAALLTIKSSEILTSTDWHIYNSFYIWLNLPPHRRRHWQNSPFWSKSFLQMISLDCIWFHSFEIWNSNLFMDQGCQHHIPPPTWRIRSPYLCHPVKPKGIRFLCLPPQGQNDTHCR
jgi:hypothetical protein